MHFALHCFTARHLVQTWQSNDPSNPGTAGNRTALIQQHTTLLTRTQHDTSLTAAARAARHSDNMTLSAALLTQPQTAAAVY